MFRSGKGYADDYYLDAKSQCAGKRGACPDNKIKRGTNNVRLLNSAVINQARTVVATCSTTCYSVATCMLKCSTTCIPRYSVRITFLPGLLCYN